MQCCIDLVAKITQWSCFVTSEESDNYTFIISHLPCDRRGEQRYAIGDKFILWVLQK